MKVKILIIILMTAINCFPKSFTNQNDSLELVRLYNSLGGENWRFNKGWDGSLPVTQWFGIICDTIKNGNDEEYFVAKINLQSNKLSGEIPELSLSHLKVLNLAGNKVTGEIPTFNMPSLEILYLSGNKLDGKIPQMNLPNIEVIDLSGNDLTGEIEDLSFKNLRLLNLSNNNLTGDIPLLECPNLESLYLTNNNFQSGLWNLRCDRIKIIDISNNKLEGKIDVLNYPYLQILNLSHNRLNLNNPKFNLPEVIKIDLSFNNINGNIEDLNCPKLKTLILNNNNIFSFNLENTQSIQEINLSYNNLVELSDLSGFDKLTVLNVSNNKLTFEDLEPNVRIQEFDYLHQDTLLPVKITRNGNSFSLEIIAKGDSNNYQWELNGELIEGGTDKIYTGTENGNYRCKITNRLVENLTLYSKIINPKKVIYALKSDSLALVEFYHSTNGEFWESSTNWLSENLILYWEGIKTDTIVSGKDSFLVVSAINLGNNNLSGNLPVMNFKYLKELVLYNNDLSGTIEEINLPELTNLDLSGNGFEGNLPIFNCPNLKSIDLSYNNFTGEIPAFNFPDLEFMDLSNNQLTGAIPKFELPKLDQLILAENKLSGEIPKFEVPLLTSIDLSYNELVGGLPAFDSPKLFSIDISNNKIVDIPDMRYLKSLDFLVVSSNKLTFEDLEKNKVIAYFDYNDQDTVLPVLTRYDNSNIVIKVIARGNANRYQWQNYGNDMFGENSDSIIVPYHKGEYRCKVTNIIVDDISYYSVKVNPELISVKDFISNPDKLEIFPNPAKDYIKIKFNYDTDYPVRIKIIDKIGQIYIFKPIIDGNIININISNLSSGSYTLILEGKHSVLKKEFMILK